MRTVVSITLLLVLIMPGYGISPGLQQSSVAPSMSVADLEKAGDDYRAQKDYPQAIKSFQEALRKEPKNAKLYNKLGLAELASGNYEAARAAFITATKYDRKYPEAWNDLGVVSFLDKNYRLAARYFTKAIALNENRANFHVNLGITYFTMDQIPRAMQQYTRALEIDPDALVHSSNAGLSGQLATHEERAKLDFVMAKVYANMGKTESCLTSLKKAKEDGYADLMDVYKDECFWQVRKDPRLAEIVPPPAPK